MPETNYYKSDMCPKCHDIKLVSKINPARTPMVDHCHKCGYTMFQVFNTRQDLLVEENNQFASFGIEELLAIALLNIQSVVYMTSKKNQGEYFDTNLFNNILAVIQEVQPMMDVVFQGSQLIRDLLEKARYDMPSSKTTYGIESTKTAHKHSHPKKT